MAKVSVRMSQGTQVEITARNHVWQADEPVPAGGKDTGPTPYEILLGALGACTAITLRLYTRHKGIALTGVEVSYDYSREHAADCRECESSDKGYLDVVRSKIRLSGDFDEAQKKRLTQIASRCPVHKTLERGVKIFDTVEF